MRVMVVGIEMNEMDLDCDACDDVEMDGDDEEYDVVVDGVVCTILLSKSLNNTSNLVL